MCNYSVRLETDDLRARVGDGAALREAGAQGLWSWGRFLPVQPASRVSLGEGNTPLVHLKRFGERIGVPNLYAKDESRNPTWSYKDRHCAVAVSKGLESGAQVIVASSTGNHGAAAAAYAARAGIPCVIFTTTSVPDVMKTLMQSYGAYVLALESANDRWRLMAQTVQERGWYPVSGFRYPPIGSNPFGIEGYKTISFETWEQLGAVPDWVSVPTCYGDGLSGIWKGWRELRELGLIERAPRMLAAEVYGSLEATLRRGAPDPVQVEASPTPAFSINTTVGTHQSLLAVRESGGLPVHCPDDLIALQRELASDEGIYAEASSVITLAGIRRLRREGHLAENETAVAVLTSTGLKDPNATAQALPEVPVVAPDMKELSNALRDAYGAKLP